MKLTASIFTLLAASMFVLQSCGSDTTTGDTELRNVLDSAAESEGIAPSECRDECRAAALVVFDECVDEGGDREECFGTAIHTFFECARECKPVEPPTCEEECEAKGRVFYAECLEGGDLGGEEAACAEAARKLVAECRLEYCEDPEPPTCEDRCDHVARRMFDACMAEIDDEERCAKIARCLHEHCIDRCDHDPCDCDDEDSDSDSESDSDSDSGEHDDECSDGHRGMKKGC